MKKLVLIIITTQIMKSKFSLLSLLSLLLAIGGCYKTEVIPKNESKKHILTFAGEGVTIKPQYVAHGTHILKPDKPERNCYDFQGWFTDNDTFTNEWNFETDIVTQDTTLYAKWERNTLRGTKWKLEGIVDVQTGELKVLEPERCEVCYMLIINTDSTFKTHTVLGGNNYYSGIFEIDFSNLRFNIMAFEEPRGDIYGDERMYLYPFRNRTFDAFFLKENELRLFCVNNNNEKKYLLYKSQ